MSQVLGAFRLLDFTMSLGGRFETYELIISLISQFFSSCGKLRVTETADTESADMGARL
jgi:hypothetical protein